MNIPFSELKTLYNQTIDALISQQGLALPCYILYSNTNPQTCPNCVFDPISNRSLNMYNGTGAYSFPDNGICPVCNGLGFDSVNKQEAVSLTVLFDSKYWFNWNSKSNAIRVPDGSIQTICKTDLLPKIRNADKILIDASKTKYGSYFYTRGNDPELAGLGDTSYIFTIWHRA